MDTTPIAAPVSTKNEENVRDPEMGYAGKASRIMSAPMNAHLGIDAESGLMPGVAITTSNVADMTVTDNLLYGEEAVNTGAEKCEELKHLEVKWHIATQWGTIPALLPEGPLKGRARSRVEPVFHIIKYRFHHRKLRYLGLKKNGAQYRCSSPWPTWSCSTRSAGRLREHLRPNLEHRAPWPPRGPK